jgi:hypothetical protein
MDWLTPKPSLPFAAAAAAAAAAATAFVVAAGASVRASEGARRLQQEALRIRSLSRQGLVATKRSLPFAAAAAATALLLLLQEQVVELQKELDASSKKLSEVSADRDLFLRRLQQLELEGSNASEGGSSGGGSALDMQRQKAHAAQVSVFLAL